MNTNKLVVTDQSSYEHGWDAGNNAGLEMGFEEGYRQGHLDGVMEERRRQEILRNSEAERRSYFLKQRLLGTLLLVLTVAGFIFAEGDATFAIITLAVALPLIFSKKRILVLDTRNSIRS